MNAHLTPSGSLRSGYTLIETLVAGAVLFIAVSAASSLSLSLVTQEEISERAARACNYLDNAARLYQLGLAPTQIQGLLPPDPIVTGLTFQNRALTVTPQAVASLEGQTITVTYLSTNSTSAPATGALSWTGGPSGRTRSESVVAVRSPTAIPTGLPRYNFFKP
jgi:type II secretory pathway pseudopilin PulG